MGALTLTDSERDALGDAISAYGAARAGQVIPAPDRISRQAADQRVDAAWAKVLALLYPGAITACPACGHITGTVPEPVTPVAYLPRAMLQAETCAAPDCLETQGLKPDGEASYCPEHR